MAGKIQRVVDNKFLNSGLDAESIKYNPFSGADKIVSVGPHLLPIPTSSGYTTNVTTATALPVLGASIAVYNNSSTAYAITIGDVGITAQAIGAVDANGNAGVACTPNAWTYLSMGNHLWVAANNAALIVYMIEDATSIIQQSGQFTQQNNGNTQPIS